MTPRDIIARAWTMTLEEKVLWPWGIVTAFAETLQSVQFISLQSWYFYTFIVKGRRVDFRAVGETIIDTFPMWFVILIGITWLLVWSITKLIPTFSKGAIIGLAAKIHNEQDHRGGLVLALYNFIKIAEFHGMFMLANTSLVLWCSSLAIRWLGDQGSIVATLLALWLLWLLSSFLYLISSFAEEGVVIRKHGVFKAVSESMKLFVSHVGHIVFVMILLLVISIRIFVSAIAFVLLPIIVVGIALSLMTFLPKVMSLLFFVGHHLLAKVELFVVPGSDDCFVHALVTTRCCIIAIVTLDTAGVWKVPVLVMLRSIVKVGTIRQGPFGLSDFSFDIKVKTSLNALCVFLIHEFMNEIAIVFTTEKHSDAMWFLIS